MKIQLINDSLLLGLYKEAASLDRLRQAFDLRTTPEVGSQRMLNALQPGTHVPIHRHLNSAETKICIEGCLDVVFYEELPGMVSGGPVHGGERVVDETAFVETSRFICVRQKDGMESRYQRWRGIRLRCTSLQRYSRRRMGRTGNSHTDSTDNTEKFHER